MLRDGEKCSKIFNTFHFLLSKKMWVIRAGIHKMLVRIANREDPFDLGLRCLSRPFWPVITRVQNLEHIL